jgi:cobalt/nickel transport system permease protein
MHMADALISPAVGGTLWVVSGGLIALCAQKLKTALREDLIPMMGVLGAFVFAAQMINFSIPGTGSSGHLGGGLMLAILLGPYAAFLVVASILTVQAFFFADGGLLALGCNIFNLGVFPAFIAYPLIYRVMVKGQRHDTFRAWAAAIVAAVAGLQLGAFGVVLETRLSGISELPFGAFSLMVLPIHLAIGLVEGLATAAVVAFVYRARPAIFVTGKAGMETAGFRPVLIGLLIAATMVGGMASWFASTQPDGLEWAVAKVAGTEEVSESETGLHGNLGKLQEKTAFLPGYGFKENGAEPSSVAEPWPAVSAGTSVSGIIGGLLTLAMACLVGFVLKRSARSAADLKPAAK